MPADTSQISPDYGSIKLDSADRLETAAQAHVVLHFRRREAQCSLALRKSVPNAVVPIMDMAAAERRAAADSCGLQPDLARRLKIAVIVIVPTDVEVTRDLQAWREDRAGVAPVEIKVRDLRLLHRDAFRYRASEQSDRKRHAHVGKIYRPDYSRAENPNAGGIDPAARIVIDSKPPNHCGADIAVMGPLGGTARIVTRIERNRADASDRELAAISIPDICVVQESALGA